LPSESFNLINVLWYGLALGLLITWLVRTQWGKESLERAPRTHHSIGVIEIVLVLYVLVLSQPIIGFGQTQIEDSHWEGKDFLYPLLILAFLAGPFCLLWPPIKTKISSGCFGLFDVNLINRAPTLLVYFVTFQGLTMLMLGITIAICNGLGYEELQVHETLDKLNDDPTWREAIFLAVPAIIIAPVFEECLFRGLLQTFIIRLPGLIGYWTKPPSLTPETQPIPILPATSAARWFGIAASSAAFAVSHANWQHAPALFILSLGLGYSYERQGTLVAPILIHALFNTIPVALMLLVPESV
jgi:membrane protease YdiL (CAAX protease family)